MDTINKGPFLLMHVLSYSFIGSQHKLLNNGLCIAMYTLYNFNRL